MLPIISFKCWNVLEQIAWKTGDYCIFCLSFSFSLLLSPLSTGSCLHKWFSSRQTTFMNLPCGPHSFRPLSIGKSKNNQVRTGIQDFVINVSVSFSGSDLILTAWRNRLPSATFFSLTTFQPVLLLHCRYRLSKKAGGRQLEMCCNFF